MYKKDVRQIDSNPPISRKCAGRIGMACGLINLAWIITFRVFSKNKDKDPEFCFVTEGELYVSVSPTGVP